MGSVELVEFENLIEPVMHACSQAVSRSEGTWLLLLLCVCVQWWGPNMCSVHGCMGAGGHG